MLHYRWTNAVKGFDMPLDVLLGTQTKRLEVSTTWQKLEVGATKELQVDPDYYVGVLKSRE
jgi:hypothetical protein